MLSNASEMGGLFIESLSESLVKDNKLVLQLRRNEPSSLLESSLISQVW